MKVFVFCININEAEVDQSNQLKNVVEFNDKSGPRKKEDKNKKEILLKV